MTLVHINAYKKCVLLQIIFVSCIIETMLFGKNGRVLPELSVSDLNMKINLVLK